MQKKKNRNNKHKNPKGSKTNKVDSWSLVIVLKVPGTVLIQMMWLGRATARQPQRWSHHHQRDLSQFKVHGQPVCWSVRSCGQHFYNNTTDKWDGWWRGQNKRIELWQHTDKIEGNVKIENITWLCFQCSAVVLCDNINVRVKPVLFYSVVTTRLPLQAAFGAKFHNWEREARWPDWELNYETAARRRESLVRQHNRSEGESDSGAVSHSEIGAHISDERQNILKCHLADRPSPAGLVAWEPPTRGSGWGPASWGSTQTVSTWGTMPAELSNASTKCLGRIRTRWDKNVFLCLWCSTGIFSWFSFPN